MFTEEQQQILKGLEQAKIKWQKKLAFFEKELSITSSAPQRFELKEKIKECQEEVKRLTKEIESFEQDNRNQSENSNNTPIFNVRRRRLLEYSGLSIGAIGITLIGKSIWNNSQQLTYTEDSSRQPNPTNNLTEPTDESENNITFEESKFNVITVNDRGEQIKQEQNTTKYFKEDLGDGIILEMVEIPGGTFMMGTEDEEIERLFKKYNRNQFKSEQPQHQVTVSSFYMSKFLITQEQWQKVANLPQIEHELHSNPFYFKGDKLPGEKISWLDAIEFCARLSKVTGKKYRLPSEAEWEYSCRAGTTTPFHFGKTITGNLANYFVTSTYANEQTMKDIQKTTSVGSFPPNAFGLYDMHGNVREWCMDNWHENYLNAPDDGSSWETETFFLDKEGNKLLHLVRGGSWFDKPENCRSAVRFKTGAYHKSNLIGFRCVTLGR